MKRRALKSEIWRPKYRDKKSGEVRESAVWWIRYRVRGEDVKISAHTGDYDAAFALLQKKKAETAHGVPPDRDSERVKVTSLLDILIADYKKRERATSYDAERRIESHLRPFFGTFRAADLMTDDIDRYQNRRTGEGAQNGTINRELATTASVPSRSAANSASRPIRPILHHAARG